ncbi:MAG: replicative DNA helicase [Candidatus Aureabacteria bacterium]|nr:replicative DNA helicase [Candidatus Auribacterota bacterium]
MTAGSPGEDLLSISQGKNLPYNLEAEKSVLGAMTLTLDAVATASNLLISESFYKPEHQEIFKSLTSLFEQNATGDLVALVDDLTKKGKLSQAGGSSYLSEIVNYVTTTANLEHHINIISEKYILRKLADVTTSLATECFNPRIELTELLDQAEKKIFAIGQSKIQRDFIPIKDLMRNSMDMVEQLFNLKHAVTGLGTGFYKLDEMTSGLQPSDMIVLASRPSMGKTAFALNILEHVALVEKKPVGFFSLEMSKEQVVMRLLCSHARVSSQKLRTGFLPKHDYPKLSNSGGRLADSPIYIDDTPGISIMELRGKARRLKAKTDCQLLMIDYLQLMTSGMGRNYEGRQQEISDISRAIKSLARELNIPIFILSQLNRLVELRKDHEPMLSDLRESGAIEQDADVVLLLTRKDYYEETDDPGKAQFNLSKQRNGPTGKFELVFNKECTRFENMASDRREEAPKQEKNADDFI